MTSVLLEETVSERLWNIVGGKDGKVRGRNPPAVYTSLVASVYEGQT